MNTESELLNMTLAIAGDAGAIADAVKKAIFHGHGIDWRVLSTLTTALSTNTATLALLAERQAQADDVVP